MSQTMLRKVLLAFVVVTAAGLVVGNHPFSIGQEKQDSKEKQKAKGRLPAYYSDIVTEAQRQQIYAIQESYGKKTAPLQEQIDALEKQRDAEIEKVLDADQKKKLKSAQEEGAAKKKKAAADKKTGEKEGDKK